VPDGTGYYPDNWIEREEVTMATRELDDLIHQAATLTADEKLQLAAALIEQARQGQESTAPPGKWQDLQQRIV
jgi:hypothetical protein